MQIHINDNLVLKSVQLQDASAVFNLIENSRVTLSEWLPWVKHTNTIDDVQNYFLSCINRLENNNGFDLCIHYNNSIVGLIGLHKIDHQNKLTSIGYWLDNEYHGKGIMTKAVDALCNYCFNELQLNRIEIACATENTKSQNIPKRLGFTLEGTLRQRELLNGKFIDHYLFALLQK
ncbi:MAG: GNAT family N-acetyltransferase [Chitinophagales bacterium]|nr:GNAT family N-acetyltransferase [Chitinophagales bacterium]